MKMELETQDLTQRFGGLLAVDDVSLSVSTGEILGVMGPNGAGKTTLFNSISGVFRPTAGTVRLGGEDITGMRPHAIARRGLVRTFQLTPLFDGMSVLENVMVASHAIERPGILAALAGGPPRRRRHARAREHALAVIEQVGLAELADVLCSDLAHGTRRIVSTAMALATDPSIVLLDEPLSGLADEEIERMLQICQGIRARGKGVVIVEHNTRALLGVSDRVVVLNFGRKIAEGSPETVRRDEAVIAAYLGEPEGGRTAATAGSDR